MLHFGDARPAFDPTFPHLPPMLHPPIFHTHKVASADLKLLRKTNQHFVGLKLCGIILVDPKSLCYDCCCKYFYCPVHRHRFSHIYQMMELQLQWQLMYWALLQGKTTIWQEIINWHTVAGTVFQNDTCRINLGCDFGNCIVRSKRER